MVLAGIAGVHSSCRPGTLQPGVVVAMGRLDFFTACAWSSTTSTFSAQSSLDWSTNALDGSRRVAQNDEADVVVSTCAFNPAFEFHRLVGVLTFLHIAYPRGLDHALTKETQSPCLCECLP